MDKLTVASHEAKLALWTGRIRECKASGLTVKEWCRQNGLGDKSYYYWMRKIKKEAFEALQEQLVLPAPVMQEQAVFSEIRLPKQTISEGTAAIIHINGVRMEIQNGACAQTIQSLLASVQGLC